MQCLKITGTDSLSFIQKQASNNNGYMAFLSPKAKIIALAYWQEPFLFTNEAELLKTHLEKFIFSEDLTIEVDCHAPSGLAMTKAPTDKYEFEEYNEDDTLIKLAERYPEKKLLDKYVNFSKGCFPGQEPLAKFKNIGMRKREERSTDYTNQALEAFAHADLKDTASLENSIDLLRKAIKENSKNEDAYETLGVILARLGRYEEAIKVTQQLEFINPNNIMAQTNLSIFFMKLGDKERAEEHKAKGTVLQFQKNL